jgi:hypothetical protein
MNMRTPFLLFFLFCFRASAALETRIHDFGDSSPALVEKQIRFFVPEKHRVSMNKAAGQVIVVAEPAIQERVAAMLKEMAKPEVKLRLTIRHNRDEILVEIHDGLPITLPVSSTPPADVERAARAMLPPGKSDLPIFGTVLRTNVKLLREDPAVARLQIVPTVLFGKEPPYEVVQYKKLRSDVLMTTTEYVDLPQKLSTHHFYPGFLRTQPHPDHPSKPIALLLSFEQVKPEEEKANE